MWPRNGVENVNKPANDQPILAAVGTSAVTKPISSRIAVKLVVSDMILSIKIFFPIGPV